ncbi:hypothetical protein [Kribbella sindirgiensis]|uniref:hypothetical protein n=1 Tax=Kribbella sindirgiensis TaxID=1124744 RepID=UPI00192DEF6D|nr:hypothetical protein [Kribbella sindirgiensis]
MTTTWPSLTRTSTWTPRTGDFWNAPFGAVRPLAELPDVVEFFTIGRSLLDN